jgi:hypothetical protein
LNSDIINNFIKPELKSFSFRRETVICELNDEKHVSSRVVQVQPVCSGNQCTWRIELDIVDIGTSPTCLGGYAVPRYFQLIMPPTNAPLTSASFSITAKWTDGVITSVYALDNEGGLTIFLNGAKIVTVKGLESCCPTFPIACSCAPKDQSYTVDITSLLNPLATNVLEIRSDVDCATSSWHVNATVTATFASAVAPTGTPIQIPAPPAPPTKPSLTSVAIALILVGGIAAGALGYYIAERHGKEIAAKATSAAKAVGRKAYEELRRRLRGSAS